MKKINKVLAILCASAVVAGVGAFAGCTTPEEGGGHTHNYQYTKMNDTQHKGECKVEGCDKPTITEDHTWGTDNKCTKCPAVKPAEVTVTGVTVSGKTTAKVGEEVQLTATVAGTGNPAQTVTWAKVSGEGAVSADGKVTATAAGEVKVKATSTVDTSKSGEYTVTFEAAEATLTVAEYVGLEDSGDSVSAIVDVEYDGEGTVTATSKNTEVATASYAEGKLTVTAVKTGKAVVEVSDGTKTAEVTVEVATAGLTYETLSAEDEDGNAYEYIQVSDGEGRTSTDLYIPGYRYSEEANEGEGGLLPVTHIKSSATVDGVTFTDNAGGFSKSNVTTVYTGDNVSVIGGHAFFQCDNLESVVCGPALKHIMAFSFEQSTNNDTAEPDNKLAVFDMSKVESLNRIDRCSFRFSNLTEFTVPETCEALGDSVFQYCWKLKTVKILSSKIVKLWGSTFLNCKVLDTIWLPKSVVEVNNMDFGDYAGMPDGGKTIDIYYSGTEAEYNAITINGALNDLITSNNAKRVMHYECDFAAMLEAEKNPAE